MKRSILALALGVGGWLAVDAQVIVYVEEPPGLEGGYDFTWVGPDDGWGSPDLNDPTNAITDTLAFVSDGTTADSLGCDPLVNGTDLAGKIAVVYRGDCQFGTKALRAETAGAIGCVIINNVPGAPVGMAPGDDGATVTIPVVMISEAAGALLKSEIDAGNVVMFIGSKTGFFGDDVGMFKEDILMSTHSAKPALVAADASEFNVMPGAWVHNYGSNDQTGVTLNVVVEQGGTELYNETSAAVDILSGDSAFLTVPTFSQPSYSGLYRMAYTANIGGGSDEFPGDNGFETRFLIDSLIAYADIDTISELPIPTAHFQPSGATTGYQACIHFRDPNASRLGALGIYASTSKSGGDSVTGEFIEAILYEWLDEFTGIEDPLFPGNAWTLDPIASGEYTYASDLSSQMVYIPFEEPVALQDDQRYLFCLQTFNSDMFIGFDTKYDYDEVLNMNDQPVSCIENAGNWFAVGFGTDVSCAVAAVMGDNTVGIDDRDRVDLTPYPNPTAQEVRIPLQGLNGNAELTVRDMAGKVVLDQDVTLGGEVLVVPADRFQNGTYLFDLRLRDGKRSTFRVVVTR